MAKKTIQLWKCEGCDEFDGFYTSNKSKCQCSENSECWLPVTATIHPQPEPEPEKEEVFEFGDWVEVYGEISEAWISGLYCGKTSGGTYQVKIEGDEEIFCYKMIRRHLRERMNRGQPVILHEEKLGFYSHHNQFKQMRIKDMHNKGAAYDDRCWRLPTQAELDEIGHGDSGWLTCDDENK